MNPVVLKMHYDNGLWEASAATRCMVGEADLELEAFVRQHAPKAQLAGNSINFDRAFLQLHMPKTSEALHYRNLDVTSFHEAARRWWPAAHCRQAGGVDHRAMSDALASLEAMRHYRASLAPRAQA